MDPESVLRLVRQLLPPHEIERRKQAALAKIRRHTAPGRQETPVEPPALHPEETARRKAQALARIRLRARINGQEHPLAPLLELPPLTSTLTEAEHSALPRAIIVDLDGTLCLHNGRDPYDETKVLTDEACPAVLAAIHAFHLYGAHLIITSGRKETCRLDTEAWLKPHLRAIRPAGIYMRGKGDTRNDGIVKYEMFRDRIFDRYRVIAVFDDRDRVVEVWRLLGLVCMQVRPSPD